MICTKILLLRSNGSSDSVPKSLDSLASIKAAECARISCMGKSGSRPVLY